MDADSLSANGETKTGKDKGNYQESAQGHTVRIWFDEQYLARGFMRETYKQTAENVLWKICAAGDCWMWVGWRDKDGYGRVKWDGKGLQAHRVVFELIRRTPMPKHLVADHLCRNTWCVNPDHLEAVTNQENILRGEGLAALNARKERCPNGHEYYRAGRKRRCRICTSDRNRVRQQVPS